MNDPIHDVENFYGWTWWKISLSLIALIAPFMDSNPGMRWKVSSEVCAQKMVWSWHHGYPWSQMYLCDIGSRLVEALILYVVDRTLLMWKAQLAADKVSLSVILMLISLPSWLTLSPWRIIWSLEFLSLNVVNARFSQRFTNISLVYFLKFWRHRTIKYGCRVNFVVCIQPWNANPQQKADFTQKRINQFLYWETIIVLVLANSNSFKLL